MSFTVHIFTFVIEQINDDDERAQFLHDSEWTYCAKITDNQLGLTTWR